MMKRTMAMVLSMVMLLISVPVFAAQEDSEKMQEVLLLVKEKIHIPEELSDFSWDVHEYNEKVSYRFSWTSPDYEKSMSVSCDDQGRITNYYQNTFKVSDKKLSGISKAELIAFAETFLRTTVPEAFVDDTDLLVYNEESYHVSGNLMYNIGFERQKDGIRVKDNNAEVYLCVVDEEIRVRSMYAQVAYDAEFDEKREDMADYQEKYQELFPVQLIYRDKYQPLAKENEPHFVPVLVYRIKDDNAGYMSSSTGEIITEDPFDEDYKAAPEAEDSVVNMGAAGGSSLTPQELEELNKVKDLLRYQDIEKAVRKLPYLDLSDKLELNNNNLYKDEFGDYYFELDYSNEDENNYWYFNVRANAKTGEILALSGNSGQYEEEKELTSAQKLSAEKKMAEFLNAVAKEKLTETEKVHGYTYGTTISDSYVRMVQGVPYINNGIQITFDGKNNVVRNYTLNFTKGNFANSKDAMGAEKAYEKILEYAPIQPVYIKSGGVYQKVFTLSRNSVSIDAISGEDQNREFKTDYHYDDIAGHWIEDAAIKLAEIQVGLPEDKLEPEKAISQVEFLRLLSSAVMGQYYQEYTDEELYNELIWNGCISKEEKAPESQVKREDAFVYIIRMTGCEKVAKLTDIYRVTYGDQTELSQGKIGYAAILSGLGVICGDGGKLRPQDTLTRAEAMALAYKCLLSL